MNALNRKEILQKYLVFLGYFTALLFITISCGFFFLKASKSYASAIKERKKEVEVFNENMASLSAKMDTINNYLGLLNTNLVSNEEALERTILKVKEQAVKEIEALENAGDNQYEFYKTMLKDVDLILDSKKSLQEEKEEEDNYKRKLLECNKANLQFRK
ncbi:type VI secretion system TssO [Cytophagaceae bacterium ABcell3]|nr:type VI secretion system TssO [Cytophagaceae bacterium ABcell3]